MNIYLDGMFFRSSGIGRCYENLLRALEKSEDVSRIFTVVPKTREEDFRLAFPAGKIEAKFVDFSHLGILDFLRKGFVIKEFRPAPDLYYFPNINVPFFWRGKTITQVNDLIPITRFSDWSWRHRIALRHLVGRALRLSSVTVCISDFTKRQLIEEYHVPADRLRVIHPWIDEEFLLESHKADNMSCLVEGDYLLYVGNRSAHKNLKALMEAFRILRPAFPALKVVVVGARTRARDEVDVAASDPDMKGHIVQFPQSSDETVRSLYAFARVFVFPSFIEGFGIPPLEALAFGVPVVCSDIPVIREVCGDAVRYADPFDPGFFAREIHAALIEPPDDSMRRKGWERVRLYNREKAIVQYLDLFDHCLRS